MHGLWYNIIMIKQDLFGGKVEVGISDNDDGNMRFFGEGDETEIIENQEKLSGALGIAGEKVARIRTVYGDRKNFTDFQEITLENLKSYAITNSEEKIPVADGLATRLAGVGILLPLADCLGIVVFDEENKVVGLLHSGRQATEQGGAKKFVKYFVKNFNSDPRKLKIYFSPHAVDYRIFNLDNRLLAEVAKRQLLEAGVLENNIINQNIDTVSGNYPSHSSGDTRQRFAIVVAQK